MGKGLIINEDVWTLLEDFTAEECQELFNCLAAFHRGEAVPGMSRMIKGAYQRVVLDNQRFDPERRAELSAKRAEAGRIGGSKPKQTKQTEANEANESKTSKTAQEEIRKEEIRIDKSRIERAAEPQPKCPLFEHEEVVTAWREWVEMRKKIRKPIPSERAEKRAINRLMNFSKGDPAEAVKILNQSVDRCYTDLYEVKEDWKKPKPQPTPYAPKDSRKIDYDAVIRDMYVNDIKGG